MNNISKFKGGLDAFTKRDIWNPETDYFMGLHVKDGAHVVINGGNFLGGYEAVYVEKGTVVINDGFFFAQHDPSRNDKIYELNCKDNAYQSGDAKIVVRGGRFVDFDPAANASESTEDTTNFVAEGYKSVLLDETYTYTHKYIREVQPELVESEEVEEEGNAETVETTEETVVETEVVEETLTVPVYEVVPEDDPREGTSGTVQYSDPE